MDDPHPDLPPTARAFHERIAALLKHGDYTHLRGLALEQDEHGLTARLPHATEDLEIVAYVGDHEGMVFAGHAHEHFAGEGWVERAAAFVEACLRGEVEVVKHRWFPRREARRIDFRP